MNQETEPRPLMVSIRCITYNHEPYIRQCLDGFVMQKTNFRFEAIVHDDASTDGTADIIREYAEKYPDIIKPIFESENQYSKHDGSLSRIMDEACTGKYIAVCEGDDYWIDPYKLQKQVDFMENNPDCTMVCNRTKRFSQVHCLFVEDSFCYNNDCFVTPQDIIEKGGLFISTCSILYRKELVDNYPDYCRQCHVGDYPLQIMCAMKGKVWYYDNAMSVYRVENNASWCGRVNFEHASVDQLRGELSEVHMLQGFLNDYPAFSKSFNRRIRRYLSQIIPSQSKDPDGYIYFKKVFHNVIESLPFIERFLLLLKASRYSQLWFFYIRFGTNIKKLLNFYI